MMERLSSTLFAPGTVRLVRRAVKDEEAMIRRMASERAPADATLWELEQMMRRDLLRLVATEQWASDPHQMATEVLSSRYLWRWDPAAPANDDDGYDAVCDAWVRAVQWAEARISSADIRLAQDDRGQDRRFISERAAGLEAALAQLDVTVRYDVRAHVVQIWTRAGHWQELDDQIESRLRDTIGQLFSFMRVSDKSENPRAVPAVWSNAGWQVVLNAHLGDHRVDAFEEWLERLPPWDGTPRLDRWLELCGFVFEDDTIDGLIAWASRSIPLVAVQRTRNPGMKHDTIPVLIGPQGGGKSTAFEYLLPPEYRQQWFSDNLRLSDKDQKRAEALQGKVIVEVAEMTGATTADIENLKAFLSRTNDQIRLAYRKNPEALPRRCSIVGTANGNAVLPNDPTGNRRFVALPIHNSTRANITAWLDQNRDQLWAETLTRADEPAWFPPELATSQAEVNETMRSGDLILEDAAQTWLHNQALAFPKPDHFKMTDMINDIGFLRQGEVATSLPTAQVRRISRVLEQLGCRKIRLRDPLSNKQIRAWTLPETPPKH